MFELTEDYDKAIIPYQTKDIALNVTAQINLRSFKLQNIQKHIGFKLRILLQMAFTTGGTV